jgi:AAA+ superfamily predicted ATPase
MSPNIHASLQFLRQLVRARIAAHFGQPTSLPTLPVLQPDDTPFTQLVLHRRLTTDEFVVLLTALAPHLNPGFFDEIVAELLPEGGEFAAIGGVKGSNFRGFLPTGETALFLLAGDDLERRLMVQRVFGSQHFLVKERVVYLEEMKPGEPGTTGRLVLDPEWVELFTLGYVTAPRLSNSFPAQRLESELEWDDLVLNDLTMKQLREVQTWIQHNDTLLYDWKMSRKIKPGYRALFYGPPGTGKTMAASLLGKFTQHEVYRIDLSSMVSKYIGETEKNLATLFDRAENKKWILFFDEADSLFGKRTSVRDAHDRFANQEVSYLLQRIEDFPGLSILASNFKSNLDDAFTRRFQSVIYFPMPQPAEREQLWRKTFPPAVQLAPDVDLKAISERYELSGSNILNIVHYCCLQALANNTNVISVENIAHGINREFIKENKIA